jgi:hypothetical protein
MKYFLSGLFLLLVTTQGWTQYYMFGGYNFGAVNLAGTNGIVSTFNSNENHQIAPLRNNFHGYRFGVGNYGDFTLVELGFGNLISSQKSTTPNQLKENAEVVSNFMSVSARAGYKPFKKHYFTVGGALHLGAERIRYSFGGDYQTPVLEYTFAAEVYMDYALRIKFLLKKSQRDKYFYLLRIRPYYQFHQALAVGTLEAELNQNPTITKRGIEDRMDHFGINISIVIPFIGDDNYKDYVLPPKTPKKKQQKNKKRIQTGIL